MNVLYIGSSAALSIIPFKKLLSTTHTVVAAGVYKPLVFDQQIIALENESLALSAQQHAVPVIDLSLPETQLRDQLASLDIDVILMSCYSKRLPDFVIKLAKIGCFNMHPSLLPEYRGPEPIFWQMKNASETGVSWHLVSSELDAGDIVKQQKVRLDEGLGYAEITTVLAKAGAELLQTLLVDIATQTVEKTPQNNSLASYFPYPHVDDFSLDSAGSAQQAFNFMRATQAFGQVYHCKVAQQHLQLREALDYDNNSSLSDVEVHNDRLYIPFNEGVLIASYTGKLGASLH